MNASTILGVDIGGTGIKAALVDTVTGKLLSERFRVDTPRPATPENVTQAFKIVLDHFLWDGPVGCGFPSVIKEGIAQTAVNIHQAWIGVDVRRVFSTVCNHKVFIANDADVAGMAEMKFGAGRNVNGTVLMITIGTGLGSALFSKGMLIPNVEMGKVMVEGMIAEKYVSNAVRKKLEMPMEEFGDRLDKVLQQIETLLLPDLIILGGGGSKKYEFFKDRLTVKTSICPAQFLNYAGIVGAALLPGWKSTQVGVLKSQL